jgi:hypothetical protein
MAHGEASDAERTILASLKLAPELGIGHIIKTVYKVLESVLRNWEALFTAASETAYKK